jgi:hypothetical protein
MTDQSQTPAPSADAGAGAEKSQPAQGASTVDPVTEVQKAAAAAQRESEKTLLDSFSTPEDRKRAEALVSKALNGYRERIAAGKDDKFVSVEMFETKFREQVQQLKVEQEATQKFWESMADMGIKPNSEDYKRFTEELSSGFYDKSKLGDRKLVERIAQAAQVGAYKPKMDVKSQGTPFLGHTGAALKAGEGGRTQLTVDPVLADAEARLKALERGRR